jgi:short-subunit dehydrogenase
MRSLQHKRVLITGAGRGLGRALAEHFARAGAEVIVTDRDEGAARTVLAELHKAGRPAAAYPLDVTDEAAVIRLRDRLHAERGPLDVLVNNAGVVSGGEFLRVPLDRHRLTFEVNLLGLVAVTHAFLPDLIARPEGHLVNIASASALIALPWASTYASSKWAVLGFSDSLREELRVQGHRHVGVTTVCPSYIDTGLFAGAKPARLTWLLTADSVAAAVLRAVRRRQQTLLLPWTVRLLTACAAGLPRPLFQRLCALLGVSTSMTGWQGHPPDASAPGR